jgi:hypothetical protein
MKAGNVAVTAIPIPMSSGPCISVQWNAANTRFYHTKFEKSAGNIFHRLSETGHIYKHAF